MIDSDPGLFWKEIGRLAGWRLFAFHGFERAQFCTVNGDLIEMTPQVAHVIRLMSVTLSETAEKFRTLIEAVGVLPHLTKYEKFKATNEAAELSKIYERNLDSLENEHGYLFTDINPDEEPEDD